MDDDSSEASESEGEQLSPRMFESLDMTQALFGRVSRSNGVRDQQEKEEMLSLPRENIPEELWYIQRNVSALDEEYAGLQNGTADRYALK